MKTLENSASLIEYLDKLQKENLTIGFVPTMGALHEGHLALMRRCLEENDICVVSIFVNPAQFNNPDDLKKYPRPLEKDLKMLENLGVQVVFTPTEEEIYHGTDIEAEKKKFDFGELERVMEGKFRPGHFKGVALIVSKLFEIVRPHKAYFGEKDYQQLLIIKALVQQKNYPIEIVPCETVREASMLAMSSRNELLTSEERDEAALLAKALLFIRHNAPAQPIQRLIEKAYRLIEHSGKLKVEYLEVVDERTLKPSAHSVDLTHLRAFVAANLGKVRLIDNVKL